MARQNQLWTLLLFFGLIGLFSGIAIWQINQSQQREREFSRVKTELVQTTQQMESLNAQNAAALTVKGKLQKDLTAAKKQLETVQKQGAALEQQLKTLQPQANALAAENSTLKVKLAAAERQILILQQSFNPSTSVAQPSKLTPSPAGPKR